MNTSSRSDARGGLGLIGAGLIVAGLGYALPVVTIAAFASALALIAIGTLITGWSVGR